MCGHAASRTYHLNNNRFRAILPSLLLAVLILSSLSSCAVEFGDLAPYFSFIYGDAPPLGGTPAQQSLPDSVKLYGDIGPISGSNWGFGFILYWHGPVTGQINPGDHYTADLTFDVHVTGGSASWDFYSDFYAAEQALIPDTPPAAVPPSGHVGGEHFVSETFSTPNDGAYVEGFLHIDWTGYSPADTLTLSIPQNWIDLTYQPVPEPSAIVLVFAAFGFLAWKRK